MTDSQPTLSLTPDEAMDFLAELAQDLLEAQPGRVALGIAGGPGVGKSTIAQQLVERLNAVTPGTAAYVPMDGFHMRQAKLEELGTAADKGAPHTFEAAAFAEFLETLKGASGLVSGPLYSRRIEDVVEDAFTVPPEVRLLVVEGNYLLLAGPPWERIRPLLDRAIFVSVPRELVRERLLRRHAEEGLFTEERNREHVERVDLGNFDLVTHSRPRADIALELITDS